MCVLTGNLNATQEYLLYQIISEFFSVLYGLGQVVTMAQRRAGVDKGTQNHRACRMEASLQSDLLDTTIYQTKYRSYSGWLYQTKKHITHNVFYQPFSRVTPPNYIYCLAQIYLFFKSLSFSTIGTSLQNSSE